MKKIDHFTNKLAGAALALAMVLLAAQAGAENVPQVIQVIQIKGKARYANDNKTWHDLKEGNVLQPGVVIQTAAHSIVDIQLSDRDAAINFHGVAAGGGTASPYSPPSSGFVSSSEEAKANIVRIFESSVLAVDKLLVERTSVDEVAETQLDLRAGRIIGNVKKLSAASKYEIKIPNGVAGIRGSFYDITVAGLLKMISGSAILALVGADGAVKTWVVNAEHGFNPTDGTIFPLSPQEMTPPPDFGHPITHNNGPPYSPPYCPPPYSTVR